MGGRGGGGGGVGSGGMDHPCRCRGWHGNESCWSAAAHSLLAGDGFARNIKSSRSLVMFIKMEALQDGNNARISRNRKMEWCSTV